MKKVDRGGLVGLKAKEMLLSFTARTPGCRKRQDMPLNCTLVRGQGTGVVHYLGFSAEYIHLGVDQCRRGWENAMFLHDAERLDVVQHVNRDGCGEDDGTICKNERLSTNTSQAVHMSVEK